ncbi:MAG: hypothetical protein Q9166_002637 [cf. Caloplaca sp. 2 TL-2023]
MTAKVEEVMEAAANPMAVEEATSKVEAAAAEAAGRLFTIEPPLANLQRRCQRLTRYSTSGNETTNYPQTPSDYFDDSSIPRTDRRLTRSRP